MKDLIERLETATEGSRELDFAVAIAAHPNKDHWEGCRVRGGFEHGQPHYTTSLDAALTLVGNNWWKVECGGGPAFFAYVAAWTTPTDEAICGWGESAALALCIAALKARAASVEPVNPPAAPARCGREA